MPMVIDVEPDGTITAQFPWCAGDVVSGAGVRAGEDGILRMVSEPGPASSDSIVSMGVDPKTLSTGQLTPALVVNQQLPRHLQFGPEDVVEVFVQTVEYEASASISTLRRIGGDVWLVTGDEGQDDASVTAIEQDSVSSHLADFCDEQAGEA